MKNLLHDSRMTEEHDEEYFDDEDFRETIKRFKSKGKSCYDFLIKAGEVYHEATKILMQRIWKSEEGLGIQFADYALQGQWPKRNNRFIHSSVSI